jgi:hypothetical protein
MCHNFFNGGSGFKLRVRFLLKTSAYWNITLYSPVKVNRRFRSTQPFHLHGRRVSNAKKSASDRHQAGPCLLPTLLTFLPWRWRRYVPPKRLLILTGPHDAISQKTELFTITALGIWNAAQFFSHALWRVLIVNPIARVYAKSKVQWSSLVWYWNWLLNELHGIMKHLLQIFLILNPLKPSGYYMYHMI